MTKASLGWFEGLLGQSDEDKTRADRSHLGGIARRATDWRLVDKALLFAVAYPLLLVFLQWVIAGVGDLGTTAVIEENPQVWTRFVALSLVVMVLLSPLASRYATNSGDRWLFSVFGWMWILVLAGASTGALASTGTVMRALVVACAFTFALAFTVVENMSPKWALRLRLLIPPIGVALTFALLDWQEMGQDTHPFFVFLAVLPLINALFDVVSYAVTITFARWGLRHGAALFWGVVDFVFALLLFLALGAALVLIIGTMNSVAGVAFIDLEGTLRDADDWRTYWWLYAMLFSTALPTAVHLGLACLSTQGWGHGLMGGFLWGHHQRALQLGSLGNASVFSFGLGLIWVLSFAVPALVLFAVGHAFWRWFVADYLIAYQEVLIQLARWAGAV